MFKQMFKTFTAYNETKFSHFNKKFNACHDTYLILYLSYLLNFKQLFRNKEVVVFV